MQLRCLQPATSSPMAAHPSCFRMCDSSCRANPGPHAFADAAWLLAMPGNVGVQRQCSDAGQDASSCLARQGTASCLPYLGVARSWLRNGRRPIAGHSSCLPPTCPRARFAGSGQSLSRGVSPFYGFLQTIKGWKLMVPGVSSHTTRDTCSLRTSGCFLAFVTIQSATV